MPIEVTFYKICQPFQIIDNRFYYSVFVPMCIVYIYSLFNDRFYTKNQYKTVQSLMKRLY